MVSEFMLWFEIELNKQTAEYFDPLEWLDKKEDFTSDKKTKYQKTIIKQLKGNPNDLLFSYCSMVKSNEEFEALLEAIEAC